MNDFAFKMGVGVAGGVLAASPNWVDTGKPPWTQHRI